MAGATATLEAQAKENTGKENDSPNKDQFGGAWGVQSVKRLTPDFGWGHDLRVVRSSPEPSRCGTCLRFSFPLCLSPAPPPTHTPY